jgi:hypothetical protein
LSSRFVDGVAWPAVIGVFCGFAAATVLNATDVMARRKGRDSTGGETGTGAVMINGERPRTLAWWPTPASRSGTSRSRPGFEHLSVGYWVYDVVQSKEVVGVDTRRSYRPATICPPGAPSFFDRVRRDVG